MVDRRESEAAGERSADRPPGPPDRSGGEVWAPSPDAAYVESETRVVVLDLRHLDRPPYVFEGSAATIWACLDGTRSEAEVVADLATAYDVPGEVVAPDVRSFVDRLAGLGLVVDRRVGD